MARTNICPQQGPPFREPQTRLQDQLSPLHRLCPVLHFQHMLKILDATMGLRVSQEGETQGLDITEHGEEGYIFS